MDHDDEKKMDESGDGETTTMDTEDGVKEEEMVEKLWAKELYEMNMEDREATTNELHGVESRYDASKYENPQKHYQALVEFENELNNRNSGISEELKRGYLRALSLNSSYVMSSDFRLRFLRAEFFDVSKAVKRFYGCLNMLVEYYGDVSLIRQLFLSDLTKPERKLLREGSMQFSPSRDPLGRRVIFFLGDAGAGYTARERDRAGLYLMVQFVAEDETSQQNGLVTISILSELSLQGSIENQRSKKFFQRFLEYAPVRISSIHLCFPDAFLFRMLLPIMLLAIGNTGRKSVKIHSGTNIECYYSLKSFGIKPDDIPFTFSGTIKTRQHTRMLKIRSTMEDYIEQQCSTHAHGDYRNFYIPGLKARMKPFPHIHCPEIYAVLFHKNGVAWDFPGNVRFREFLDLHLLSNNDSNNNINSTATSAIPSSGSDAPTAFPSEKQVLIDRIIRDSFEKKFQFLLHDDTNHWYNEIQNPVVLKRYIALAIRGRQRRMGAKRQRIGWDNDKETSKAVFTNMSGSEEAWTTSFCQSRENK